MDDDYDMGRVMLRRRTDHLHRRESDTRELTSVTVEDTVEERRILADLHRPFVTEQQLHDELRVTRSGPLQSLPSKPSLTTRLRASWRCLWSFLHEPLL